MEYFLLKEKKQRYLFFIVGLTFAVLTILFSVLKLGLYGLIMVIGLLFYTIITPVVIGRYKLFLFLWIVALPFLGFIDMDVKGINLLTFFITGLSFPFAVILFYNNIGQIIKKLPYTIFLLIFMMVLCLNFFTTDLITILQIIRARFIELFIISITFFYLKKNSPIVLVKWISLFIVTNALIAIFQRFTGIGMVLIEGFPRVQGLTGHPNSLGLLINIYFPIGLFMFFNAKEKKHKLPWGFSLGICFIALILSLSKTSLLIFCITMFILFLNLNFSIKIKTVVSLIVGLMVFAIMDVVLGFNTLQNLYLRFQDTSSWNWRLNLWAGLLNDMSFIEYFTGKGINSCQDYTIKNMGVLVGTHNGYIQLIYEYGMFGLIYIASFWYVALNSLKTMFSASHNRYYYLVLITLPTIIIVEAFFDQVISARSYLSIVWVIITIFYLKTFSKEKEFDAPVDL